jgi:hypothetical protein
VITGFGIVAFGTAVIVVVVEAWPTHFSISH